MQKLLILKPGHSLQSYFCIWHFTSNSQYIRIRLGTCSDLETFQKTSFGEKQLIGDTIINFCWCHQILVSGLYSTHQSPDLVNDITIRHLIIRGIPGTRFISDSQGMTYAPLYTHTILKKVHAGSFDTILNLLNYYIFLRISRIYSHFLLISLDEIDIFASVSEEPQRV